MKKCCKNCKSLNFYDWYFCAIDKAKGSTENTVFFIDNIEKNVCENFSERNNKFWTNGEW